MFRVAVLSDVQLNQCADFEVQLATFTVCLSNIRADAVAYCGDLSENALAEEWEAFFNGYKACLPATPLLAVPGNMDRCEEQERCEAFLRTYGRCLGQPRERLSSRLNFPAAVLLGLAVEQDDDTNPISAEGLHLLDAGLRDAAARGVPALVFGHYLLNNTLAIDWEYAFLGPQSATIQMLFAKYGGQVLYFSGHTHHGLTARAGVSVLRQGAVTYLGTPSLCMPDTSHYHPDDTSPGTGYLVEIEENAVRVQGFDFLHARPLEGFHWSL